MSALGKFGTASESFPSMLTDLNFDDNTKHNTHMKTIDIAIRCTYYIFCEQNKPWTKLQFTRSVGYGCAKLV